MHPCNECILSNVLNAFRFRAIQLSYTCLHDWSNAHTNHTGEETMNGMGVAGIGLAHALVLGAGITDLGLALVQKGM